MTRCTGDGLRPLLLVRLLALFWLGTSSAFAAPVSAGNTNNQIAVMINLATTYQSSAEYQRAEQLLQQAVDLAQSSGDRHALLLAKGKLGAACTMTRQLDRAESLLRESLEMARADGNSQMTAAILNDLGNVLGLRQKYPEALAAFQESVAAAGSNKLLVAQALCNAASTAARGGMTQQTDTLNAKALKQITQLDASHEKAFLFITAGESDRQIKQSQRAIESFRRALEVAEAIGDHRAASYALGYTGEIYEQDKQFDQALSLTRQAIFEAQQAQIPDALYRWEWQSARLLRAQGEVEPAMAAYRRAIQTLQPIRHDISLGYGNATTNASFREAVGPLFFEMADLLLQQAGNSKDPQPLLVEARDTVEQLKTVELEDYFQDECCDVARTKAKTLEAVDGHTAVVYLIPLPARTEVLVGLASGLHRFTVDVGADALATEVREFRHNLETRTTYGYLAEAQQLYDWIIRPIHGLLSENHVDTLVFVPDGALRTIPLASLHDGKRFLIEEFAVAVAPGLSLIEPRPIQRANARLLLSGLSKSVQGFPSLDFVPAELRSIETMYPSETLLNKDFVLPAITRKLTQEQYTIVHIASHGQFNSDAHKTFVLTYDGKLTLNDLEALIRPSQYRGKPVELLVLSACQTASGDDRAALGLAGVAIKAGARSAMASLWFVNDQSTSALISELYHQLSESPPVSKARALQAAQIKMLNDRRYRHPCYWAPYLIIGNWL
jgi:CHAT domain-containing protein/Tfp pilus assembly protein PilF